MWPKMIASHRFYAHTGPTGDKLYGRKAPNFGSYTILVKMMLKWFGDPNSNELEGRHCANLPQDAIVVGSPEYFMELRSPNYYGIEAITTPNWFLVKYQGYELWQVTRPVI